VDAYARRAASTGNPYYEWLVPMWRAAWSGLTGPLERAWTEHAAFEALAERAASPNATLLVDVQRFVLTVLGADRIAYREVADRMLELIPPELSPSSVGCVVHSLIVEGREVEARLELDRLVAGAIDATERDAEWLPCIYMLLEDAIALDHRTALERFVELAAPYADRCAIEGIVAGFEGPLGLVLAEARSLLGDHDRAVDEARAALERSRGGRFLHARAQRALAGTLARRNGPGDRAEAATLSAEAASVPLTLLELVRGDQPADQAAPTTAQVDQRFVREGDVWRLAFAGSEVVVRHAKGLADLAALLARPGVDLHVTDLEPLPAGVDTGGPAGDPVLDRRALTEYRQRLVELDDDLADAEAANDGERTARAKAERDLLLDELRAASGLGGRRRTLGPDPIERVRKAVTGRIRASITKVDEVHPALGRHLANAVRTGVTCSYRPEQETTWLL
jgi:hypothetical protein